MPLRLCGAGGGNERVEEKRKTMGPSAEKEIGLEEDRRDLSVVLTFAAMLLDRACVVEEASPEIAGRATVDSLLPLTKLFVWYLQREVVSQLQRGGLDIAEPPLASSQMCPVIDAEGVSKWV